VANKLYPLSSIAQQIEDFAKEKLLSVVNSDATESMDAEGSFSESQKVVVLCIMDVKFHSCKIFLHICHFCAEMI
jgi:hypothetical protein